MWAGKKMPVQDWFYFGPEGAVGPLTDESLSLLAASGAVTAETRVWHGGLVAWRRYAEVSAAVVVPTLPSGEISAPGAPPPIALAELAPPLPTVQDWTAPMAAVVSDHRGWSNRPLGPWRRLCARLLDTFVHGFIGMFLFFLAAWSFAPLTLVSMSPALWGVWKGIGIALLLAALAVPVGALFVGLTGSSFGKFVFGVKVVDRNMQPVGLGAAFRREASVWLVGMGAAVPVVNLICAVVAYRQLGTGGLTVWDRQAGSVVLHRPLGVRQYSFFAAGSALLGFAIGFSRNLG